MTDTTRIQLVSPDEARDDLQPLYERADKAMTDGELPGPTLFGNQIRLSP